MVKKYHVYGVGNALVDMEFEVTPQLLQELNIDKGVMTLVDEDRQNELITKLDGRLGKQSGGGSAANTMVAISQLGGKGFYSCKVADDDHGNFYLQDLQDCGLDTNYHNGEQGTTGKCLVMVTPDADRTMNTFLGITANLSEQELVPEAIADAEYLYLEGYLVTSPTGKEAAIKAREIAQSSGVKTSFSLSDPNMVAFFKEGLLKMIGSGLDLVFANEAEALKMADTQDFSEAINYFKTIAKAFAITRGSQGSLVFDGQELIEVSPYPVQAIDTVGAGDMYAGAFLYGITHGMTYGQAGDLASRASSRIVTTYGARLTTEELKSLLNN
ncbi:PfkB domain protein [Rippkaea orientalis PCC 8801]|uniref:PfkB domain protein n=1 Tax=Rippkaea orientalis (strain PCC 8801 / RF-1) TaxID=41431 RepID=B7K117_RIPO1|nr:adenosine kinase [Rippkaea orientalis]ACK65158.1 PfkB domain protein [Rippkaea orientalis PCC 8801]